MVRLELTAGEKLTLCWFFGEGSAKTGWRGVLLDDDVIDVRGEQREQSLAFARRVAELTGAPLMDAPF